MGTEEVHKEMLGSVCQEKPCIIGQTVTTGEKHRGCPTQVATEATARRAETICADRLASTHVVTSVV